MDTEVEDQSILSVEIMEVILKHLDVRRLKTFRLVCRSWNIEICRILRKKSVTCCGSTQKSANRRFFSILEQQRELNLPTPFHQVDLAVSGDMDRVLEDLRRFSDLQVIRLTLRISVNHAFCQALNLLQHCSPTLVSLEIQVQQEEDPSERFQSTHNPISLVFPKVQQLAIDGALCFDLDEEEFRNCFPSLTALKLCREGRLILEVGPQWNLHEISLLALWDCPPRPFNAFQIKNLRRLQLSCAGCETEELIQSRMEFLAPFTSSLQELELTDISSFNFKWVEEHLPVCPHLTHFAVGEFKFGSSVLWKMPKLQVLVVFEKMYLDHTSDLEVILPVSTLQVLKVYYLDWPHSDTIIEHFYEQFPNVQELTLPELDDFCQLQNTENASASQVSTLEIRRFHTDGSGMESKVRFLNALTHLNLGIGGPAVDFRKLPNLQVLQIYWDESFDVASFAESVKHLQSVVIKNCCKIKFASETVQLFADVPRAVCGCKTPLLYKGSFDEFRRPSEEGEDDFV